MANHEAVTRRQVKSPKPFQAVLVCPEKYLEETKSRINILFEGRELEIMEAQISCEGKFSV